MVDLQHSSGADGVKVVDGELIIPCRCRSLLPRAFLVYTRTALPVYKHEVRQDEDDRIRKVAGELSGHLYKRYLNIVLDKLDREPLPDDWLELSSMTLSDLLGTASSTPAPAWASSQTHRSHA